MYLLFAPQGHLRERITRLLGSRFDLILAKSWDELEQRTVEATCTLIAIDRFDNWIQRERLHVFRERHHVRPLIVVTQGDAYNIRHLQNIPVNATIFLSELDKKLPEAIRYHCSADFLKRLAEYDLRYFPTRSVRPTSMTVSALPPAGWMPGFRGVWEGDLAQPVP